MSATGIPTAVGVIGGLIVLISVAAGIGRRTHCAPEERRRIAATLMPATVGRSARGMNVLFMTLSVVISVMGISADSAAVVIGAMLIAPLSNPILATSLAIAMGWPRKALSYGGEVLGLCAGGSLLSLLISTWLPDTLTGELLSRTSPDLRDLLVAFAAGLAGSYATVRADMSAALPGVAVAVALVPPLAAIGMTIEQGRPDLTEGAVLLLGANLAAIIVSSIVVFLATNVVPSWQVLRASPRVAAGSLGAAAAVALVAVPLVSRTLELADDAGLRSDVTREVRDWLGGDELELVQLDISESLVVVELAGEVEPPAPEDLARRLVPVLGPRARVDVRWSQRSTGTADDDLADSGGFDPDAVEALVSSWGADQGVDLIEVGVEGFLVNVSAAGDRDPPAALDLADLIAEALDHPAEVVLSWSPRLADRASSDDERPEPDPSTLVRTAVERWVAQAGWELVGISLGPEDEAGSRPVTLTVRGDELPEGDPETDLVAFVFDEAGHLIEARIRFVELVELPLPTPEPDPLELLRAELVAALTPLDATVLALEELGQARTARAVVAASVLDDGAREAVAAAVGEASGNWTVELDLIDTTPPPPVEVGEP